MNNLSLEEQYELALGKLHKKDFWTYPNKIRDYMIVSNRILNNTVSENLSTEQPLQHASIILKLHENFNKRCLLIGLSNLIEAHNKSCSIDCETLLQTFHEISKEFKNV